MQNYLIYRAYGQLQHMHECRYALLKYLSAYNLKPPANTAVVVYTDHPDLFEAYIPFFPRFQLQEIAASEAFGPRPEFARYLAETYRGNLLYCDTDTFFPQPPHPVFEKIKNGSFCLHGRKEPLRNQNSLKRVLADFFSAKAEEQEDADTFPPNMPVFYTAAIGFSHTSLTLLKNVSELHQHLNGHLPPEDSEELAFGFCLNSHKVSTLENEVISYKYFPEFKKLLQAFFEKNTEESVPNLVKRAAHLDVEKMREEKERFLRLPLLQKWLQHLTGKAWSVRQYQNKL